MPKHNSIENISRMLQVLRFLARDEGATVTEIANKTGMDRWSVKDMIVSMENFNYDGKGLYIEEFENPCDRRQTVYRVAKDNLWTLTLPGLSLTDDEGFLLALLFSQNLQDQLLREPAETLKQKLQMFVNLPGYEIINVSKAKKAETPQVRKCIETLLRFVENDSAVGIKYKPFRRSPQEYTLRPLGVFKYDSGYYLAAQKLPGGEYRTFSIDRIAELPKAVFYPEGSFPEKEDYVSKFKDPFGPFNHKEEFEAVLRLNSICGDFTLEKKWDPEFVSFQRLEDESVIMKVRTHTVIGIRQFILGFGSAIEVISPQWLKDEVREEHRKAALQ